MFYQPMLDCILLENKISPKAFMAFVVIARHMNEEGKNAFPATGTIAFILRTNERSIQRFVKELVTNGYLKTFPRKRHSTTYELGDKLTRFLRVKTRQE